MAFGIPNETVNRTLTEITDIVNATVYNGILYFVLLWILWIVLYRVMQGAPRFAGRPMVNLMYGGAAITILALFLRIAGLLNDSQTWIFPIITVVLAVIIRATNK